MFSLVACAAGLVAGASSVTLLNRIEGRVRGVARMIKEDCYRIDIFTWLRAVHATPRRVEGQVPNDHGARCLERAISKSPLRNVGGREAGGVSDGVPARSGDV